MRFSVLIESFCGFAVVDNFFDGLEVSNRPSFFRTVEFHTGSCFANWKSLFVKLQIIIFVLFCVLNYSRPRSVISFEFPLDFFFIIFYLLLLFFWKWRAVVFLTSHLNLVSVLGSLFLHLPALSSISFVIFHSSVNFQCSVTPVFCYCYYFVTASSSCKWNTEVTFIRQWWQNRLHVVIIWFSTLLLISTPLE